MSNHEIKKNFNEELRQLTVNDSAHADTFNPLFEQLINNDATLKETIEQDKTELLSEIETVNTQLTETAVQLTEIEQNKADKLEISNMDVSKADKTYVETKLNDIGISQINKNKGKIDETYLSDTLLQQIAGEAPISAIPADDSITIKKLAFPAIVGKVSKNLFNKDTVEVNKSLNSNTGQTFDAANYFVSDYFAVEPNTEYYLYSTDRERKIAFYDEEKGFLQNFYRLNAVTSPELSRYVRITTAISEIDIVQFEKGISFTGYEPFLPKIEPNSVGDNSLTGDKLVDRSLSPMKLSGYNPRKNLFNKNIVNNNKFIAGDGSIGTNVNYVLSDYIPIQPNTDYVANELQYSAYFDENKQYISGNGSGTLKTQRSPIGAAYIRVSVLKTQLGVYQFELGTTPTPYNNHQFKLEGLTVDIPTSKRDRLFTFRDTWIAWNKGEKFPVGFLGDSTTDGAGTTGYTDSNRHEAQDNNAGGFGKVDYICTTAYPYILEQLIKKETGKNTPRIYNIGYSGTYFDWAKPKLNDIFGSVYADVKMVGITYGINDRTRVSTVSAYEELMRTNLDYFINYFFNKGIQPFMVTSQATVEPYDQYEGTYPLRTSEDINSIANRVKREMADKYNLEIIERTDFDEHVLTYSQYALGQLINDTLHFSDKGHELSAEYIFSHFCPRVVTVKENGEILGFTSQRVRSRIPAKKNTTLFYLYPFENGFKVKANYTKSNSNDLLIQDFWILNLSKKQLNLKAYVTNVGTQYVKLNGTLVPLTSNGQSMGTLDIGLHHVQAFSGASTTVDFKGFILD